MAISRLFLVFALTVAAWEVQSGTEPLVIASWNVENLFDYEDDPDNPGDDGYTPRGWMRWSERRYRTKLDHLAGVIREMKPQVLCLAEVENRRVLEDLTQVLKEKYDYPMTAIIHREGTDLRGIDVAMLAVRKPEKTEWKTPVSGQRDVLAASFDFDGRKITVLANHWKSQLGDKQESEELRRKCAQAARGLVDKALKTDPSAAVVVTGDFNDVPESEVLTGTAGFVLDEQLFMTNRTGKLLFNLSATVPESERLTYYYASGDKWSTLDMFHISRGMWNGEAPWKVKRGSMRVFKTPRQCNRKGEPLPFKRQRNKTVGDVYLTGYSDHFPILMELEPGAKPKRADKDAGL